MKLILDKNQLNMAPEQWLRRAGYGFIRDRQRDKESFVRRLGSYHYPRLHMYASEKNGQIVFDLHLDQKQASYQGSHMHNAEYDGPVVEAEIDRLKKIAADCPPPVGDNSADDMDLLEKIEPGDYSNADVMQKEKKSWWKRLLKIFNF